VRLEMRRMVGLAIVVGVLGAGAVCGETKAPPPDKCPNGPDGRATITFQMHSDTCVVVEPVESVCVDRGNSIHWTLTNKDCAFKAGTDAVVISPPAPKGGQKAFKYAECSPNQPAWPAGKSIPLNCKVPKEADVGLYKYSLSGQIKTLDPDIEVRKGH